MYSRFFIFSVAGLETFLTQVFQIPSELPEHSTAIRIGCFCPVRNPFLQLINLFHVIHIQISHFFIVFHQLIFSFRKLHYNAPLTFYQVVIYQVTIYEVIILEFIIYNKSIIVKR